MENVYGIVCRIALGVIGILIFFCAIRSVKGPQTADRLVAINMITTLVSVAICVLTFLLGEGYLADVALIFSLMGCMAVVVMSRIQKEKKDAE